jgi:hypothetical protein
LDRLRQRRATLVAKTIINQMATQPLGTSTDESLPSLVHSTTQRFRPPESSPVSFKYSARATASSSPEIDHQSGKSQQEFLQISQQISSLLAPSDEET